jgi:hypothetical protein
MVLQLLVQDVFHVAQMALVTPYILSAGAGMDKAQVQVCLRANYLQNLLHLVALAQFFTLGR